MFIIAGSVRVNPDRLDDHERLMRWWEPQSRAADGCLLFSAATDRADPTLVRVVEVWASDEAHAAVGRTEAAARLFRELEGVTASAELVRYEVASAAPFGIPE